MECQVNLSMKLHFFHQTELLCDTESSIGIKFPQLILEDISNLFWYETLAGSVVPCTSKLCSMLQQRQRLEDLYQDSGILLLPQAEPFTPKKRAPGMEFLGKRNLNRQQYGVPLLDKRAPGQDNSQDCHYNPFFVSRYGVPWKTITNSGQSSWNSPFWW